MKENLRMKTDNTFWEWDEDNQYIRILWILETEDGKYYQKLKKIKIGANSDRLLSEANTPAST